MARRSPNSSPPVPDNFSSIERTPPHNPEAERSLIGSMLRENGVISDCIVIARPDHFYDPANRLIFESIISIFDKGQPVDVVVLAEDLKKRGQIEEIGGYAYLGELWDATATAANAEYYARIVRDKGLLRLLIGTGNEILREAYAAADDADQIMHRSVGKMITIADAGVSGSYHRFEDVLKETYDRIDVRTAGAGMAVSGVPTGYTDLDTLTAGFQNGEMIIIAARPSIGKTAFALNLARNMAVDHDCAVLFCSLEQSRIELAERLISCHARIDLKKIRNGSLSVDDLNQVLAAGEQMRRAKFFIDDSPNQSMLRIAANARRMKQTQNLQCVFIDYLQLIEPENRRDPRQEQVAQISRRVKMLARELSIPVVTLAQVNRSSEDREGNVPKVSDLRESGSLEQDADTVMLLHRPERHNAGEREGEVDVIIGKQRNGPVGQVTLSFVKEHARFDNHSVRTPFDG